MDRLRFKVLVQTFLLLLFLCSKARSTIVFDSIARNSDGTVSVNGTLKTILWIGGTGDYLQHIPVESQWNRTFMDWSNPDFVTSLLYQVASSPSVAAFEVNDDPTMLPEHYAIIRFEQTLFDIDLGVTAALRMSTTCFDNEFNDASMSPVTINTNIAYGDGVLETMLRMLKQTNSFGFLAETFDPMSEAQGNLISILGSHTFFVQGMIDLYLRNGWMHISIIHNSGDERSEAVAGLLSTRAELAGISIISFQRVSAELVDSRVQSVLDSRSRIIALFFLEETSGEFILQSLFDHGMTDPYVYVFFKQNALVGWTDPYKLLLLDGCFNFLEEILDLSAHYLPLWERAREHDAQLVHHMPAGILHVNILFEISYYQIANFALQGYHYYLRPGGYKDQCASTVVTIANCSDWTPATSLLARICCSMNTTLRGSLLLLDRHPVPAINRLQGNITSSSSDFKGEFYSTRQDGTGFSILQIFTYNGEVGVWILSGRYLADNTYSPLIPIRFRNGGTTAPLDLPIRELRRTSIAPAAFVVITIFSGLSIAFAFALVVFNNKFRSRKVVWLTSPNMNNVILLGAIGFYICAILLGIDRTLLGGEEFKDQFLSLCLARTWLVQLSFTLLFGSLVAKIYRVYKVFTSSARCKTSRISDKQLFIVLNSILFVNVVLLLAWTFTDTIISEETTSRFEPDANDINLEISTIGEVCSSTLRTGWLVAFTILDFLLLGTGAFLAFKTRNVAIEILKNAKEVGIAIYTSSLIALLVIPILNSVSNPDIGYVITGFGIILGTNVVLVSLFQGPILAIWRNEEEQVTKLDMNSLRSSQGTGQSTELQTTDMPDNTVPSMDTDTTTTTTTDTTTTS